MKLQEQHIRLIKTWYLAAQEGRTLILTVKGPEGDAVQSRMREIALANPLLFPQEA